MGERPGRGEGARERERERERRERKIKKRRGEAPDNAKDEDVTGETRISIITVIP